MQGNRELCETEGQNGRQHDDQCIPSNTTNHPQPTSDSHGPSPLQGQTGSVQTVVVGGCNLSLISGLAWQAHGNLPIAVFSIGDLHYLDFAMFLACISFPLGRTIPPSSATPFSMFS